MKRKSIIVYFGIDNVCSAFWYQAVETQSRTKNDDGKKIK